MAVDVVTEIVVARPAEVVSAFAANPDNVPVWYANIASVEWKTDRPLQLGSKLAFVAQFLGRRLAYTYEIVEWVPGARLVMRTAEGPFPMETTYTWTALGPTMTRMTLRNRGNPTGFSRWLVPIMGIAVRRANAKDLQRLKRVVEGAPGASR